jgi:hypothetical protein
MFMQFTVMDHLRKGGSLMYGVRGVEDGGRLALDGTPWREVSQTLLSHPSFLSELDTSTGVH